MNTYRKHYEECRRNFGCNKTDISNLKIERNFEKSGKYFDLINSLKTKAEKHFEDKQNCFVDDFRIGVKDASIFPEVHMIHEYFYQQIANRFFSSNYTSNRIQICKSLPSEAELFDQWIWHYDDVSNYHVKFFVYLSNIESSKDGAFCHAADELGNPVRIRISKFEPQKRIKQIFENSRVPQDYILSNNFKEKYITGNMGECFLFSPNIIHKAIVPEEGHHRMVLIYHYHPATIKTKLFNFVGPGFKDYRLI